MGQRTRKPLKVTYDLFRRVSDGDFEYIYRGMFTQNLTRKILSLAESNLQRFVDLGSIQNRIYFVMVEGLQNATRQLSKESDKEMDHSGIFAIQKVNNRYLITTGNTIANSKVDSLKQKLENTDKLDRSELKKLHHEIVSTGELSDKGSAGLGLIEIARKSGNKLLFDFEYIDIYWSYIYLQTEILGVETTPEDNNEVEEKNSMWEIKNINRLLSKKDILLNFNGSFNQNNILSLLSIIKGQMSVSRAAKKVYYIMVEMLQNISKHGDNYKDTDEGSSGIFYLGQTDEEFILTSGNYIRNKNIKELKEKLDTVNSFDDSELNEYFNKILLGREDISPKKTGLGFVDMRLKCNRKITYNFRELDDMFSFFTLQTSVQI